MSDEHGIFNADKTRYATDAPVFGIACYEGKVEDGEFVGHHRGLVQSHEDAMKWLRGEDVDIKRTYPVER